LTAGPLSITIYFLFFLFFLFSFPFDEPVQLGHNEFIQRENSMTNCFDTTEWTAILALLYIMAVEREDLDFADALQHELGTAVETVLHLEACYDLQAV
jgi:hypothetical protein